jgi:hypothetical protein
MAFLLIKTLSRSISHEVLWECGASSHRFRFKQPISQKRREDACALQKLAPNGIRRLACGRNMGYQAKP